jgi:phospholipid transport system substrate-binding protein
MFDVKLRFSALVAIAAIMAFGAAPALAQTTMVTDAQSASTAGRAGPLNVVTTSVSRVLTMARAAQTSDAAESGKRRAEIRQAAEELFDFDEMSRRLLGQRWMDASPQQQHDFTVLLADLLQGVYLNTLGNFSLANITFQGETITGSFAQVRSKIATGNGEIAIEYRMFERDGQWAVYDVAVDGVSLVSNYRSQFNSILKRISFAQLLDHLRNREAAAAPRQDYKGRC